MTHLLITDGIDGLQRDWTTLLSHLSHMSHSNASVNGSSKHSPQDQGKDDLSNFQLRNNVCAPDI